ncbi:MAG: hypothetical protein ACXW3Z_17265 [Limisphaerales bacterium]
MVSLLHLFSYSRSALANEGRTLVTMGRAETRYRRAIDRATDRLLQLKLQKEQNEPDEVQLQQNLRPAA